jgi:hypothetical protein
MNDIFGTGFSVLFHSRNYIFKNPQSLELHQKHRTRKLQPVDSGCFALPGYFECVSRTHLGLFWTLAFPFYMPKFAFNLLAENHLF